MFYFQRDLENTELNKSIDFNTLNYPEEYISSYKTRDESEQVKGFST